MASYNGGGRNARTAGNDDGTCGWGAERDMRLTLGEAYEQGFHKAQGNRAIALKHVENVIDRDRRFDTFKTDRLLERFEQCRGTGAYLDFNDPYLQGGERRPAAIKRGSQSLG